MNRAEIDALIKQYEDGTRVLKEALAAVPAAAMQ